MLEIYLHFYFTLFVHDAVKTVVSWNIITYYLFPVFSVSYDPSEIILLCYFGAHFYENSYFCILWWIDSLKEHNLFKIFYCNIINYFYVTFDQFDAFLLNKSINFLQKIILTPDFEQ